MDLDQVDYDEFINSLEDYVPTRTGFECNDIRIKRLISLATQKFISSVADDSLQYCKIRQQAPTREKVKKEKSLVLTMDDLSQGLKDYGFNIRKPEYFAETIPQSAQTVAAPAPSTSTSKDAAKGKGGGGGGGGKETADKDKSEKEKDGKEKDGKEKDGKEKDTPSKEKDSKEGA
ncbi:hypothetical protein DFA_08556 [Cavenderia fasciculata]|uniref:Transcription initiation factor TFIID subunit 10 n=1 Tax=Cavenderia fasciculata TaxID=261658 RepID=F4Q2Z6_CACFS|nr:uncharacterized protein DFA_08556 [Cavenderia fasciculata]EGG17560.1 hypothetical protein DFA_08556 [Cavenderia fasciculata]|eukprot:XP_004356044.1 hypothetical protein DFA_08556 [Cavenderia fasciculata]